MKRINEMTREEIIVLTNEQINMLIDYDCAMEGKPLLPPMPIEPITVDRQPDLLVYKVADVTTMDIEHATRIIEAINSGECHKIEYVSGPSYQKRLVPEPKKQKAEIASEYVFSPERWDRVKNEVHQYDSAKEQYKKQKKEYDDAASERAEISEHIWELVSEARDEEYRRDRIRNDFNRYLELSEGNRPIALNFLRKAHNVPDDMVEELAPLVEAEAN